MKQADMPRHNPGWPMKESAKIGGTEINVDLATIARCKPNQKRFNPSINTLEQRPSARENKNVNEQRQRIGCSIIQNINCILMANLNTMHHVNA